MNVDNGTNVFSKSKIFMNLKGRNNKMNELMKNEDLENMIYEIRGVQVMLDSDLAKLYQVETKRINEAVKRNPEKFPEKYCWILSDTEMLSLRSQNATSSLEAYYGGRRYAIRVFTEQGIAMLATILKSKIAIKTSLAIIDAFVNMRHYIRYNKALLPNRILLLEDKVDDNSKRIKELFDRFDPKSIAKNFLFFENKFYDAYSILMDILNTAKKEIIIIDNYANKELLDLLKEIDVKVIIISRYLNDKAKEKYECQYTNVTFIHSNEFHDRFIFIDKEKLYSCGASLKDLGKRCFAINEMEDDIIKNALLEKVKGLFN